MMSLFGMLMAKSDEAPMAMSQTPSRSIPRFFDSLKLGPFLTGSAALVAASLQPVDHHFPLPRVACRSSSRYVGS